jgi:hypothetical protein
MTQRFLSCALALVVSFSLVVPIFGGRTGSGGGQGCQKCDGWYSQTNQTSVALCVHPEDGSSGNTQCRVVCATTGDAQSGGCSCVTDGDWCYYIVVNG